MKRRYHEVVFNDETGPNWTRVWMECLALAVKYVESGYSNGEPEDIATRFYRELKKVVG